MFVFQGDTMRRRMAANGILGRERTYSTSLGNVDYELFILVIACFILIHALTVRFLHRRLLQEDRTK